MDREHARRILGVAPGADRATVTAAFRRQVRSAHPDHGGDPARFRALVEGYQALLAPPPPSRVVVVDRRPRLVRLARRLGRRRGRPRRSLR